ncbi:hypothetical protein DFH11DRAFT_1687426 [Phellopilus nigrolimitatus]|nr:hypothetical protein DFH11DRAFT_1687426 [Phellopilus nigrolimitatus]
MKLSLWQTSSSKSDQYPDLSYILTRISEQPPEILLASGFAFGSLSTLVGLKVHARYFRRFRNSNFVTPDIYADQRWVKGVVTSVGDADNFRLYHTPGLGWRWPLKFRWLPRQIKGSCSVPREGYDKADQTLHIRMAGIDAPEGAHFGKESQEYYGPALAWTKETLLGKTVYCKLVASDRYSRSVAIPMLPRRWLPMILTPKYGKCVSLEMLRDGWAVTYEQTGAEYGKFGKQVFLDTEAKAKKAKKGQWIHGTDGESPAEYKRRYAQMRLPKESLSIESVAETTQSAKKARKTGVWKGFFRKFFSK